MPARAKSGAAWLMSLVALALAIVAGAISYFLWQRQHTVEAEMARKVAQAEGRAVEMSASLKSSQDSVRELQARLALTESKVADSVSQQAQLEKLYRELARNRDDWELADAEQAVQMAAQQLQSAGNTRAALAALQDADARLSRINQPAQIGVRRLLTRDIERLQSAQATDTTSIVNQLDLWIGWVDRLALQAPDRGPVEGAEPSKANAKPEGLIKRMAQVPQNGWESVRSELSSLFRVRRVDTPEAMFVAPDQAYFGRENLKLRLASARLAVLTRNDSMMRAEVGRSQDFLQKYFDARDKQVEQLRLGLGKIRSAPSFEAPSLNESLAALRALRQKDR
jgi:uncharacterized protein HemX